MTKNWSIRLLSTVVETLSVMGKIIQISDWQKKKTVAQVEEKSSLYVEDVMTDEELLNLLEDDTMIDAMLEALFHDALANSK
jgi:hypothetical protein